MKKMISFILVLVAAFVLVGCNGGSKDVTKPVINGAKNHTYVIGATVPNWLNGVTATDDVDGSVTVTVDASALKLDVAGTYDLVYKAADKAGNEATKTVKVTVVAPDTTAPVIAGTRNITLDLGADKPNWLEGVTVTDNEDKNPVLTVDDSLVKLDQVGEYNLVYNAVDASGNKSSVTVIVTVLEPSLEDTIVFGVDAFNQTATTSVGGVGVALYYDATEGEKQVASSQVRYVVTKFPEVATGESAAVIGYFEAKDVHYFRAYVAGEYELKLFVADADEREYEAVVTHKIIVKAISTNPGDDKADIRNIYPLNVSANPDHRANEGTQNEFLIVGKTFTSFVRHEGFIESNFAAGFVGFGEFEGGHALEDFTITFKYTKLTDNWKLLFSVFSGEEGGNDGFAGDWLRILTNRNEIGIVGDNEMDSPWQDSGEAKNIPLKEGPVYIKFSREFVGDDAYLRLHTSLDGLNYTLQIEVKHENASKAAGQIGAKLTGFVIFSIDNDFILEDLEVASTAFKLAE